MENDQRGYQKKEPYDKSWVFSITNPLILLCHQSWNATFLCARKIQGRPFALFPA
jgi:hypothetical protein